MKEPLSIGKRIKNIAPVRLIVISFAVVILIGAALLTLPISARDGQVTNFVDALFTATSATCVTGLVVVDTWTHFNGFGQAVILFLIQVGGLGIVTFTTGFTVLMRRKLSLKDMMLSLIHIYLWQIVLVYRLILVCQVKRNICLSWKNWPNSVAWKNI